MRHTQEDSEKKIQLENAFDVMPNLHIILSLSRFRITLCIHIHYLRKKDAPFLDDMVLDT